jgi:hypothetical protein
MPNDCAANAGTKSIIPPKTKASIAEINRKVEHFILWVCQQSNASALVIYLPNGKK